MAVEIDRNLIPILGETLAAYDNVHRHQRGYFKGGCPGGWRTEYNGGRPIKVVANLPYYITTPIIMGLFESDVPIDNITVMVQKEVADRMQVGPGVQGLWGIVPGGPVLCRTVYCGQCTAQLLHTQAQCGLCGDPAYQAHGSAGDGPGRAKLMFKLIRASFNQRQERPCRTDLNNSPELPFSKEKVAGGH